MNTEALYRYVMDSAMLFVSAWVTLLGLAFTFAFRKSGN
jgi:hypothetical protein